MPKDKPITLGFIFKRHKKNPKDKKLHKKIERGLVKEGSLFRFLKHTLKDK